MKEVVKPILIDAVYVNMGGGLSLLRFLVSRLIERGAKFFLLRDSRCPRLEGENLIPAVHVLEPSELSRKRFYKSSRETFKVVLCFGNVPPPVKIDCPVHTYFHNVNTLQTPHGVNFARRMKIWLKRKYISLKAANTDSWIVQTTNTEECLRRALPTHGKQIYLYPFYHIPSKFKDYDASAPRTDYVLVGDCTGSRGHEELLKAWRIMHEQGVNPRLHLTVSPGCRFAREIELAVNEGVNIENHGILPFERLADLYHQSKATVYPSVNESLGLGIVEALEAGCDVIGADRPYLHSICRPSAVFGMTPQEIAQAVLKYEAGVCPRGRLLITSHEEELLNLLSDNE